MNEYGYNDDAMVEMSRGGNANNGRVWEIPIRQKKINKEE